MSLKLNTNYSLRLVDGSAFNAELLETSPNGVTVFTIGARRRSIPWTAIVWLEELACRSAS